MSPLPNKVVDDDDDDDGDDDDEDDDDYIEVDETGERIYLSFASYRTRCTRSARH